MTDADQRVTELEKALREEPRPTAEAEAEIRGRLSALYLDELGEPLSAAVHIEALLTGETVASEVFEAATRLLEHRPIAARIAERLSSAYERLGQFASELGVLTKELALAKSPRLEVVKRRLADLHFDRLEDADGALQLLEPLVQRTASDDTLRTRYVEIASVANQAPRAIRALMRASRSEKDDGVRTRILCDLGELYFAEGEIRRARQAFVDAITVASDPRALDAARRLLHLETEPPDPKVVCAALEVSIRFEPDPGARHAAAERLLTALSKHADDDRATVAWRALIDSPRRDEALAKLSELLEKRNDVQGLVEVLRAQGASREAQARLVPLLEKAGLWAELAEVLDKQAGGLIGADAAAAFARLGRVRLARLGDGEGAVRAFRRCLELDPKNATSRSALEKMMREGAHRLEAASVLEETYRSQGFAEGLVRVFEARAELATSQGEKLPALAGAFEAAEAAGLPAARLAPLAQAALAEAARSDPGAIPTWLSRVCELAKLSMDPTHHAEMLADSLGFLAIDCRERIDLACAAIDALLAAKRTDRARALCAAGLAASPASVELLGRYDAIVGAREDPGERLLRYQAALERTTDETERRGIMQVIAAICRESLDDLPRAIELWQRILKEDPKNLDALMGLFSAYERLDNPEALFAEIEQALENLEGQPRQAVLLRKAAALAKFGERERSSEIRGELLKQPNLRNSIVESILTAAYEDDQPEVYREALEIQSNSENPTTRMLALERLGDFHFERLGDRRAAIDSWKPAARLYTKGSAEDEHARELYERVLEASPDDREAAWKLVELYAKAGEWARLPEVFGALLRSEGGLDAAIERLLELESGATEAGAVDDYVSMVDETVPRLSAESRDSLYRLIQAKARILSSDPARQSEASDAHKYVIETFGGENDIAAFQAFIDARGSADDRQADLRWLYAFRANRSPSPGEVLAAWAKAEEDFGDVDAAIQVYERARGLNPHRREALEALARLKRASADFEGCLEALRALREQTEPSRTADLDLSMARILAGELDRPIEAVEAVAPHLASSQRVKQALNVVRRAIRIPEARTRTIAVVEGALPNASRDASEACLGVLVEEAGRDASVPVAVRCRWYRTLVELRGNDVESALESALDGVEALPNEPSLWELVERVAHRADRLDRLAEAYRRAIEGGMVPEQRESVGKRVVHVLDESSSDSEEVLRTIHIILAHVPGARWALDRVKLVLSAQGRWEDLFGLYDRAIEGTETDDAKAELLNEAAVVARDLGRNHERAVSYLEKLAALRPDDVAVQAALERLYERHGLTTKLIELLSLRVESATGHARMELSHRIASSWLDLGRYDAALSVVEGMLERGAPMEDAKDLLERMIAMGLEESPRNGEPANVFERTISLLSAHYSAAGLTEDLIRTTKAALALSSDPALRARCARDLVRMHLETQYDADDAYTAVRGLVAADLGDDPALEKIAGEALLDEATKDWQRQSNRDCDAARTSWTLVVELSELCLRSDNPKDAIAILGKGADLPFTSEQRRALRSQIAFTFADRANDPKRAMAAFQELFDEDAGDDVAARAAERFAALLEEAGRDKKRAEHWGRIGEAQSRSKNLPVARDAWIRAADLWVALKALDRATAAYREAASLGSTAAIETLARLYTENEAWLSAAQALEWLFGAATEDAKVRLGLAIADAYDRAGERDLARSRLAELLVAAPRERLVRERLIALHREDSVWGPLAALLVGGAAVTDDRDERLRLLVEGVGIYIHQLKDPATAIPHAEAALELDPESTELCLDLGQALDAVGRHDDAVGAFTRGLRAQGERRPKNAGLLHRALARALIHAGRRGAALEELGTAARLSPSEPSILYDLAKLATEEGNLDVAERTLRALLLALHHPTQANPDAPSRAEVYLDLSRVLEAKGDAQQANDLVESAFDSALENSTETVRLEHTLERRGRYNLMTVAIERRLRSAKGPAAAANALDALVALWEGPLARADGVRATISRHAELIGRDVEEATTNVDGAVWAALVRANAAIGEINRAVALVEPLFLQRPTDRAIWEALRDLHTRLDRRNRLLELAETALSSAKVSSELNLLRLDLATLLLDQPPKVDAAVTTLRKLLEDDPGNVAASTLLSSALEGEGRHAELVSVLSAMLDTVPAADDPEAHFSLSMRLARALEGASRASDAAALYARLSREGGASVADLRDIAARLDALGSEALADCLERLARLESGPEALASARRLVELRTATADSAGTLRALELGFRADPGDSAIVQRLAEAHQQAGDQERALSVLDMALTHRSSDVELLRMRAWLHDGAGRYAAALSDLENALLLDSSLSDDLVTVLAHAAAAEVGDDGRRSLALFDLLLRADQSAEARAVMERLLDRAPNHVEGLERLASLCASEGDWAGARVACQRLLPLIEGDPEAVARVSIVLADACGDGLGDAKEALEHALELVPGSNEIRTRLAKAYEAAGDLARLADLLEEQATEASSDAEKADLFLRAAELVLESGGTVERALELSQKSRDLDSNRVETLLVHARAQAKLGRLSHSLATLREVIKSAKGRGPVIVSRAYFEMASIHLTRDEIFEGFDALNQSFNADPKNDEAGLMLGLVAVDLEDERTALRALRTVTATRSTLGPADKAVAFYHLARIARVKGDLRRAKQMATSAVAQNSDHAQARALLEAL